jgi:hypothetical protein
MVPKSVFAAALVGAALLAGNGPSVADEYRPGDFFSLDLSKAVLSPKRLGPETQFAPVAVEADSGSPAAQASPAPKVATEVATKTVPHVTIHKTRVAQALREKPRGEARTRLARRHSNPLDAQALDTRIQVWPCRSGGICNWQRK